MASPKKSEGQFPKITQTILTLLLLHGEVGFIIAVFKLCSLNYQTGTISIEEALALLWMTFRSVTDLFMGLNFFFALLAKPSSTKWTWMSYGMFATCFDTIFATVLFQRHHYVGLEVTSLAMDAMVKLTIAVIMNDMRKKSMKISSQEERLPLLA